MLAKQLDEAHHELAKTKQIANEAQLRAESVGQEIAIIKVRHGLPHPGRPDPSTLRMFP